MHIKGCTASCTARPSCTVLPFPSRKRLSDCLPPAISCMQQICVKLNGMHLLHSLFVRTYRYRGGFVVLNPAIGQDHFGKHVH
jgi:hypothetical protein